MGMKLSKSVIYLLFFLVIITLALGDASKVKPGTTPLICEVKLDGNKIFQGSGQGICGALSCFDPSPPYYLREQCFPMGTYTFHNLDLDDELDGSDFAGGQCITSPSYKDDSVTLSCELSLDFSGGEPNTNPQKCAGTVRPLAAANDMGSVMLDVWKGNNYCCGYTPDLTFGKAFNINGKPTNLCLVKDTNPQNSLPDSIDINEPDTYWAWQPANQNKYHIYHITNKGYDVISNGDEWFNCNEVLSSSSLTVLGGSPRSAPGDDVVDQEGVWLIEGGSLTGIDSGSGTLSGVSLSDSFNNIQVNELNSGVLSQDSSEFVQNVKTSTDELISDLNSYGGITHGSKSVNSFICHEENDLNKFLECCGGSTRYDAENCVNAFSEDRIRRQGEPVNLISDMNAYAGSISTLPTGNSRLRSATDSNKALILPLKYEAWDEEIHYGKKGIFEDALKQNNFINDWTGFNTLEFFFAFGGSEKLAFVVTGSTGVSKQINNIMDYSVNGHEPVKWHHIIIPLSYFQSIGLDNINDFYFFAADDYYTVLDKARVKLFGQSMYNAFYLDRMFLNNPSEFKFCGSDFNFKNDLDDDAIACMDTPGYFWTATSEEVSNYAIDSELGPCCGDDQNINSYLETGNMQETFSGGKYAGCWDGRTVLNGTRLGLIEAEVEQGNDVNSLVSKNLIDMCSTEKCYLSLRDTAKYFKLKNVLNDPDSEYDISFAYDYLGVSPMYTIEGNDLVTTKPSQQVEFLGVPLPLLYSDNEFHACEVNFQNYIVNDRDFCDVEANYFCSYGDPKYGNKEQKPGWSDEKSGYGAAEVDATRRDTSKGVFEKRCMVISGDFNGDGVVNMVDLAIYHGWLASSKSSDYDLILNLAQDYLNTDTQYSHITIYYIDRLPNSADDFNDDGNLDNLDSVLLEKYVDFVLEGSLDGSTLRTYLGSGTNPIIDFPGTLKVVDCALFVKDTTFKKPSINMLSNPEMVKNG